MRTRLASFALGGLLLLAGCSSEQPPGPLPPLRLAFLRPPSPMLPADGEGTPAPGLEPNVQWALEKINAAGGVAGRVLAIDTFEEKAGMTREELAALGEELAADDQHLAVIGPGASDALLAVADSFVLHEKPLVCPFSTSAEVLRAYGGKGFIWRTRESDIAQAELLVRFAQEQGAQRIALVSSLDADAITFFSWFGFFALELGYGGDMVTLSPIADKQPCDEAVQSALAAQPDMVFVATGRPELTTCAVKALAPPAGKAGPRVVLADTGHDVNGLRTLGPIVDKLEGFSTAGSEAYAQAFQARFGPTPLAPHGPAEHDALLLLAYALQASGGEGGAALDQALRAVVDGREGGPLAWDQAGVAGALAQIREGGHPDVEGATGKLEYHPDLYVDLTASTLAHWTMGPAGPVYGARYDTGDAAFLSSERALVHGSKSHASSTTDSSGWAPSAPRTDTWALVAALSSGWDNYRHQADALRQYQLLRAGGVPEDHIVLVMADDIAGAPENPAPGVVRNTPGGPNLHHDLQVDYGLSLKPGDLADILTGKAGPSTPRVLHTTASSDLYVYLVGHGGDGGITLDAGTASEGLSGASGAMLTPDALRRALCTLRGEVRVRRVLVAVESCHGGVLGEASKSGVELGCFDSSSPGPLDGVLLLSAASPKENSFADGYDPSTGAWLGDAFSRRLADLAQGAPGASLVSLYSDVYLQVTGSHVSLYNAAHAGAIGGVPVGEFFMP